MPAISLTVLLGIQYGEKIWKQRHGDRHMNSSRGYCEMNETNTMMPHDFCVGFTLVEGLGLVGFHQMELDSKAVIAISILSYSLDIDQSKNENFVKRYCGFGCYTDKPATTGVISSVCRFTHALRAFIDSYAVLCSGKVSS